MAKAKTLAESNLNKKELVRCNQCNKDKRPDEFYKNYTNESGYSFLCKECFLKSCLDDDGKLEKDKMIKSLQRIDRPFVESLFIKNANKYSDPKTIIGFYLKDISLKQFKNSTFKDSLFENSSEKVSINNQSISDKDRYVISDEDRSRLIDKWGDFTDMELVKFERKYQTMSKSYQILSQMHEESLINVCRLEVFYTTALKEKNAAEIKLFGEQLAKAKQEAKLNPNQLSKNDLTATGANSFGEIAKIVSQRDGILRLPMKYITQPNDRIDILIWDLINYNRALKGMPEVKYEEIYKFYTKRIEDFNKEYNADLENGDLGDWDK